MVQACEPLDSPEAFEERRYRALASIAAAVASAHELHDVLELAAEQTRDVLGVSSLSISRWHVEEGMLQTLINVGELGPGEERWPLEELYALGEFPLAHELLRDGRPHITTLEDAGGDPAERALLVELGKAACAAIPITYQGATWGEVYVTRAAGGTPLQAVDVQFMQAICAQLAVAIGRAELFSQLVAAAYRDALTDLANRRAFDERLTELTSAAVPRVALLLGDLDGLKTRNDNAGHEAGDRALQLVGRVLQDVCGPGTLPARLGGDEFCVIVEEGTVQSARELAAEFDRRLEHEDPELCVSWGVAEHGPDMRGASDLLRMADAALYAAKRDRPQRTPRPAAGPAPADRRGSRTDPAEPAAGAQDSLDLLRAGLDLLDGRAQESPRERCIALARLVAERLGIASWALSGPDGGVVAAGSAAPPDRTLTLAGPRGGYALALAAADATRVAAALDVTGVLLREAQR